MSRDLEYQYYFKLFNNLKDDSESELAGRELASIFSKITKVRNFIDEFVAGDFPQAVAQIPSLSEPIRIQDAITYELPYGEVQGFKGSGSPSALPRLVRRLAYTREIYLVIPRENKIPRFDALTSNVNLFTYASKNSTILRAITNQYFLEKSYYISKLSRNKDEVDANLETLLNYAARESNRMPASETMAVGRRLQDWFAIREEPSLYLTHYMHPYKGKFHPKMAKALINYMCPEDKGLVLDNFSGSGTTLVEAQWLGLSSIGVDINPLSSLMSDVKVRWPEIGFEKLRVGVQDFLARLRLAELVEKTAGSGQSTLSATAGPNLAKFEAFVEKIPASVRREISDEQMRRIMKANEVLNELRGKLGEAKIEEFILLGISGAISDVSRRTSINFLDVLEGRLRHLLLRIYLGWRLADQLGITFGSGECFVGDTRYLSRLKTIAGEQKSISDNSIDCVVDSPPYSTALDYIRNDLPQLSILQLAENMDLLERNLVGNPNLKVYDKKLQDAIVEEKLPFSDMPEVGKQMLLKMLAAERRQEAGRVLKFWVDMKLSLSEIHRVLKPKAKAAIVLGNNNIQLVKGSEKYELVPNIEVIQDLGATIGLRTIEVIQREIEKSMSGMIRNEAIIVLQK